MSLAASHPLLDRLTTVLGLRRRARQSCRDAAARGERLRFGWTAVYWDFQDKTVVFPFQDPEAINYQLARREAFLPRLPFTPRGKRLHADLRQPALYHLPTAGSLFLPVPAEPIDFFTGYFARGEPRPGDIALDAGAYCGEMTLELAKRVGPSGHVFAFEPDAKNLVWLRRNIERSGFTNITVVPKGLWGKTTTLEFYADENPASSLFAPRNAGPGHPTSKIDVLSPGDAFALIGRVPDFVKMDIEGAEIEVVGALAPALGSAKTRLAIASYHLRDGVMTSGLIEPVLAQCGLSVETGYPPHQTTWAWRS